MLRCLVVMLSVAIKCITCYEEGRNCIHILMRRFGCASTGSVPKSAVSLFGHSKIGNFSSWKQQLIVPVLFSGYPNFVLAFVFVSVNMQPLERNLRLIAACAK